MDVTQLNRLYGEPDAPCVLIRGPEWGDASFLGAWLRAAGEAQALWQKAFTDSDFAEQMHDRVCIAYIPHFGMAAGSFVMRLREYRTTFVLRLENEEGDEFTMMAKMGFFAFSGGCYQMIIPSELTAASVKRAALVYAATEDKSGYLHPERLITTMSYAEAGRREGRLQALQAFQDLHNGPERISH
jgi:hypothetical protein